MLTSASPFQLATRAWKSHFYSKNRCPMCIRLLVLCSTHVARTGMMRSCVRAFAVPRRSGLSLRFGHAPRTFQHLRREEFCIGFLFREVSFTCYSLFKHRAGCPMHPSSFTFAMVFSSPEACDTAKVWSMFPRAAHRSQVSSSVCHQKLLICCGIHHGRRSEKFPD